MSTFAGMLSAQLNVPVIDGIGLHGKCDFNLEWVPAEGEGHFSYSDDVPATDMKLDDVHSSLFTAIQEQLGLKLEACKGPVQVMVIDHIDKPTGADILRF